MVRFILKERKPHNGHLNHVISALKNSSILSKKIMLFIPVRSTNTPGLYAISANCIPSYVQPSWTSYRHSVSGLSSDVIEIWQYRYRKLSFWLDFTILGNKILMAFVTKIRTFTLNSKLLRFVYAFTLEVLELKDNWRTHTDISVWVF